MPGGKRRRGVTVVPIQEAQRAGEGTHGRMVVGGSKVEHSGTILPRPRETRIAGIYTKGTPHPSPLPFGRGEGESSAALGVGYAADFSVASPPLS